MRYVYSLIRFVPEPANGEFIVVGAVAGSEESSEWEVRQVANPVRARALDRRGILDSVWAFMDRIGRDIDAFEAATEELFEPDTALSERWLLDLHRRHRNIVQVTSPTPMIADSSEEALDRIFDEMIIDPARLQFRFKKKHAALATVRRAYRAHEIPRDSLSERVTLHAASYSELFDFAITNGRTLQLVHTWSFQIPDQTELTEQIKAWGWTVERLRDRGGVVITRAGDKFDVDRNVDIEATYVPPEVGQDAAAFVEALDVFRMCNVLQIPYLEADVVGRRASELLSAAAPE
jgi:hypothetical protein